MSIEAVCRALESFSQQENHHAIVLKGDWGTGKTFLWNSIVKSKKEKFKTKNYSYVSLFGLTSLKDVKQAIYENTVSRETAGLPISYKQTTADLSSLIEKAKRFWRRGSTHASNTAIPFTRPLDSLINSIQYSLTTDTLICIDDFERKSDALGDREILGLITNLVELKNCRVILILNSNTIAQNRDYFSYHEKVFSYEIEYTPTPQELINLVFNERDELDRKIIHTIKIIKTSNIRLYKKIKFFTETLRPYIEKKPDAVVTQTLSTLVLAIWSIYGADPRKVEIDFILNFTGLTTYMTANESEDKEAAEELKRKADLLYEVNFLHCDKLDEAIIRFVQQGYFDENRLSDLIQEFEERIAHDLKIEELRYAWRTFHYSYNDDEDEVINNFLSACDHCLPHLDASDINAICKLYSKLNHDDYAQSLVDRFIEYHLPLRTDFDSPHFSSYPPYPYLLQKLDELKVAITPTKDVMEVLQSSADNRTYYSEDTYLLSQLSASDLFKIFKSLKNQETTRIPSYLLSMGSITAAGDLKLQEAFDSIFINAFEAILMIRDESTINQARTQTLMQHESRYLEKSEQRQSSNGPKLV